VGGSIAAPGPRTARYGGNTPCVEIRAANKLMIVDAGTGIRELGLSLMKQADGSPIEGSLFIGHTHWDHIQGFPFFSPLYLPTSRFIVHGMHGTTRSFREIMDGQMSSTYFPVQLRDLASKPAFVELAAPVMIGPVKVSYHFLNHPGITVGFRFEHDGKVVSYISDHEPYAKLNRSGEFADKEDAAVARFIEGSDLLICEAQYTADEYLMKKGWGHSTFEDVLDLAVKAGARRVALFHHDPGHDDDAMDAFVESSVKLVSSRGQTLEVFAAREGLTLEI
jgi:phosphoribosyl 1,2-cyclic phosphodiesterase